MHEVKQQTPVLGASGPRPCQPTEDRLAQCQDAEPAVVACGAQHGERLANPPQSPAGAGRHAADRQYQNVEGVRSSCGQRRCRQGEAREAERLAPVGPVQGVGREPVHPEGNAEMSRVAPPHGSVCTGNVLKLLEYQGYRCALTGRRLTPQDTALDHIVPIRQGGEHVIENAQVLHKEVNRAKGSLSNNEFLAMCLEVVDWSGAARGKRADEAQDPLEDTATLAHGPRSRP